MKNKIKLVLFAIIALLSIGGAIFVNSKYNEIISLKNDVSRYRNNQRSYDYNKVILPLP